MFIEIKERNLIIGHYDILHNIETSHSSFLNYFEIEQRINEKDLRNLIKKIPNTITVLKYIQIEPEFQNKGFGKKYMQKIIEESSSSILLISELRHGFVLDWYLKLGFEIIGYCHKLPILLLLK